MRCHCNREGCSWQKDAYEKGRRDALREAADAIYAESTHAPYNASVVRRWLRARAEKEG